MNVFALFLKPPIDSPHEVDPCTPCSSCFAGLVPRRPQDEKTPEGVETEETTGATQWVGLYADTLPCADCPGILTQLDLRADSTYVMRDRYLERDSIPYGTSGQWTVSGDMLTLNTADVPIRWKLEGDRLVRRYTDGGVEALCPTPSDGYNRFIAHAPLRCLCLRRLAQLHACGSKFIIPAMDEPVWKGQAELERTAAG